VAHSLKAKSHLYIKCLSPVALPSPPPAHNLRSSVSRASRRQPLPIAFSAPSLFFLHTTPPRVSSFSVSRLCRRTLSAKRVIARMQPASCRTVSHLSPASPPPLLALTRLMAFSKLDCWDRHPPQSQRHFSPRYEAPQPGLTLTQTDSLSLTRHSRFPTRRR